MQREAKEKQLEFEILILAFASYNLDKYINQNVYFSAKAKVQNALVK